MFADTNAYNSTPFPGTSSRQSANLKEYDSKYAAAAKKLKEQGYTVVGDNYFKKVPDAKNASGYRLEKVGKINTNFDNEILKETAATAQPPRSSSGNVTSIGGKNYDLSNPTQKAAYNKVIAADVASRPDQRFADLRGGGGLKPVKEKTPPTPEAPTGRDAEPPTRNPNNIPQKGTIMGRSSLSMKDAQEYVGTDVQIKNPFLSNALPGTNDDGFSADDADVMGMSADEAATIAGGGSVKSTIDGNTPIETKMVQGSANLVQSGTGSAAPTGEKTNDINDPSTWDEKYARRRAFLDADDSMSGLKAVQAQKRIVYAGGQYYMNTGKTDKDGNAQLEVIKGDNENKTKADVKAYMRGAQGAEDLKNKYIDKITTSKPVDFENVGETPIASSYVESPVDMNESPAEFEAPLTDMPSYTEKDHTGRFNIFRRS